MATTTATTEQIHAVAKQARVALDRTDGLDLDRQLQLVVDIARDAGHTNTSTLTRVGCADPERRHRVALHGVVLIDDHVLDLWGRTHSPWAPDIQVYPATQLAQKWPRAELYWRTDTSTPTTSSRGSSSSTRPTASSS